MAATSLNEFLDSIIVAQTLGMDSMSLVNMASPIIFVYSTIYTLMGLGGSTVYASLKGKLKKDEAASVFSLVMLILAIISTLIFVFQIIFFNPIVRLLSNGLTISDAFDDYILVLFISAPFIILLQGFLMFLPAEGKPQISMAINIIANVVNIIFDIVFTTVCKMQVMGAACATLTGYIIGGLVIIVLWYFNKCRIPLGKITKDTIATIREIIEKGTASAIGQFGLLAKISFSNQIAILYAGSTGIAVFSACNQTISITSIFLGGLLCAMTPILAILYSQEDYNGVQLLTKNIIRIDMFISLVLFLFFEVFSVQVLNAYGITHTDDLKMGISALRIFSIMYLFRQTVMVFIYYAQTVGRKNYAVALGIMEGFAGCITLTVVFTHFIGITGLWLAYPTSSMLILIGIILINRVISSSSGGRVNGFFLIPTEKENYSSLYFSLNANSSDISEFSSNILMDMKKMGIDEKRSTITAVACEELCIFINEQDKKHKPSIDVIVHISGNDIHINFCSVGSPFSIVETDNTDRFSNLSVLYKLAKKVDYDYIIGLNETHLVL